MIKNVGYYDGVAVNVRIDLKAIGSNDGGEISISDPSSFLDITIRGKMAVTYRFENNEGTELPVETTFTYNGLNVNKSIGYKNIFELAQYLIANDPTDITYDTEELGENSWTYLKNKEHRTWRHPTQAFQLSTKKVSEIETIIQNLDSSPSSLMYETGFLATPEFSGIAGTNTTIDDPQKEVTIQGVQTVPSVLQSQKMKNLKVDFMLDSKVKHPQYKVKNFRVTKFNGEDVSDLFEGKSVNSNEFQLAAKNTGDNRLYDTVLNYQIVLEWIGSKDNPVDKDSIENNYLKLPFSIASTVDSEKKPNSSANTSVNYNGQVIVEYLNQETGETLLPLETISGVITDPYDLSERYPEITGYYPIKENENQGIYTPEPKKVSHFYKEGSLLNFSLIDAENPLRVSHFKKQRKLKIRFSHNTDETIRLIAQCGDERLTLGDLPNAEKEGTSELQVNFSESWLDKDVDFYVENDKGERSNIETRHLILDKGIQFFLPANLTFGVQEIPSYDKSVEAINQKEIQIKDESMLEEEKWTVKVKEEKKLTNKENKLFANNIEFLVGKEIKNINTTNQVICEGSGNIKLSDIGKLRVIISPTDFVGEYEGTLIWTLEQAPK
ncbi:MucBP domain-containing protein [Enterococcus mundtii]|uniref:MucBP domain-containing protein n=1 Tax=Enterococcus mundtii TaxID=53346 RepID=UPI0011C068D3|nr:MucBP domain-containing protein [Enterococcus mundtii]